MKIHPAKLFLWRLSKRVRPGRRFPWFSFPSALRSLDTAPELVAANPQGRRVVRLPGGIATWLGTHLDASRALFFELSKAHGHTILKDYWIKRAEIFPKVHKFPGRILSLATEAQTNYYHWLIDVLPKLAVIEQVMPLEKFAAIYCSSKKPFHRESLEMLGIPSAKVIPSETKKFIECAELFVVEDFLEPTRFQVGFLRERFSNRVPPANVPRIYISRRNATSRRIVNEVEIIDLLQRKGFKTFAAEELTFRDQIGLFRSAQLIIAPHGAGLTNLAFASPGVRVIELFPKGNNVLVFRQLAELLGGDFCRFECQKIDSQGNFFVEAAQLESLIDRKKDLKIPSLKR